MDFPTAPIFDYRIAAPLAEETRAKLDRAFGPQRAGVLWAQVCAAAGCKENGPHSIDDLIAVGTRLKQVAGLAGVYGCSLTVRARSFRTLRGADRNLGNST